MKQLQEIRPEGLNISDIANHLPGEEGKPYSLDPGIKKRVMFLRSHGVRTFSSCQGGEGHQEKCPQVSFLVPLDLEAAWNEIERVDGLCAENDPGKIRHVSLVKESKMGYVYYFGTVEWTKWEESPEHIPTKDK